MSPQENEREFRQILSQKISGTSPGMWLLIPELHRLGAWDILKAWTKKTDMDLDPRIAMQMVNEAALCVNRVRRKNSLGHQGFQLANGMSELVTDEQIHGLLGKHTMEEARDMLVNLGIQRELSGHYPDKIIAIDPHRIISSSKREMAKKRKDPKAPSQKVLQTFFSVSAHTGQPIMATISSTGLSTTKATSNLLFATDKIKKSKPSLLLADKEHFTKDLFKSVGQYSSFNLLTPALNTSRIKNIIGGLSYQPLWAGFALAETKFNFDGDKKQYRLIAQRIGENKNDYTFNAFLTTSSEDARELISKNYDQRWSVEEFFRFENDMGLNRASSLNLNIRYGKMALAMIAQAATYQLRMKLKGEYKKWNAQHLSNEILSWSDGNIRVSGDTIIVTFYGNTKHLNMNEYVNLPKILENENINPHIPWLYGYKLDFRFK
ncbi:MAG: transposase [Bacteroidales bacterium]